MSLLKAADVSGWSGLASSTLTPPVGSSQASSTWARLPTCCRRRAALRSATLIRSRCRFFFSTLPCLTSSRGCPSVMRSSLSECRFTVVRITCRAPRINTGTRPLKTSRSGSLIGIAATSLIMITRARSKGAMAVTVRLPLQRITASTMKKSTTVRQATLGMSWSISFQFIVAINNAGIPAAPLPPA